jgi:putative FmdB family regulatory protein
MPTYDYECPHCGHTFELFQKITDEPLKNCPKCKKEVKRLIGTGSGIIFKGSGFYATDYRKGRKLEPKPACPNPKKEGCDACPHNQ